MQKKPYQSAPEYYHYYFDLVGSDHLLAELEKGLMETSELLKSIPKDLENHRYAEGKWSVKQVFRHLIDCERIFAYRALRFSRNDKTELAGFDEDEYNIALDESRYSLEDLVLEFASVRISSIKLFSYMTDEMLDRTGFANGYEMSVRAIGFMLVGHPLHHIKVLKERYLK